MGGAPVRSGRRPPDTIVIGAGAFGAWTARRLQQMGRQVLLLDAWGPAHSRASSGDESRMTRGSYGADLVYTRMALDSLGEWSAVSDRAELPLFHRTGVLFFFSGREPYCEETIAAHRSLGLPTETLGSTAMRKRFPQIDFSGIEIGLYEPQFGALMARRAIHTLVAEFVAAGGEYRQGAVLPPAEEGEGLLREIVLATGERLAADQYVFACGAWLPKLFPRLLGSRIFPTRQAVFYFATPTGDESFAPGRLPGWADFNHGDFYYGFPDLEGRGFKIAHDVHGPPIDPDSGDRAFSDAELADVRAFMERRFPVLASSPLNEARICQYENSANGDLLIDFHPDRANVLLVGAGSGHGFKHGPAVGDYSARVLAGTLEAIEPRFSLASKSETKSRSVH
jgi:sarcosine oxidase